MVAVGSTGSIASLCFSPNDVVFAHKVHGPMSMLKDGLCRVHLEKGR